MRYAFILLFLCACQRPPTVAPVVDVDPAFQTYVDEFVSESVNQSRPIAITNLIIHFSTQLDAQTLGDCQDFHSDETNIILINANAWPQETDVYRKVLLFHELGHCILHRPHLETGSMRGGYCTPTSIMWPYMQNKTNMYLENWNDYMVELFTGVSSAPPCSYNNYWGGT